MLQSVNIVRTILFLLSNATICSNVDASHVLQCFVIWFESDEVNVRIPRHRDRMSHHISFDRQQHVYCCRTLSLLILNKYDTFQSV